MICTAERFICHPTIISLTLELFQRFVQGKRVSVIMPIARGQTAQKEEVQRESLDC